MTADCMEPFQQTTDETIKLCVLTGATSGIGKAAALQLCKFNTQLILLSRNISKGSALVNKINSFYGPDKARFIQTDISNFAQVRSAANHIKDQHSGIAILINNAGARFNNFQKNADGIELTFATNHLGHFLLTRMLLNLLEASPEGRIINISSSVHCGYSAEFDKGFSKDDYDRKAAYGLSKLANLLFTYELARRLADTKITVNALHPGMVASSFAKNNGLISWLKHVAYYAMKRQLISPARAAEAITYLALSEEVQGVTGKYFSGKKEIRSSGASYDQSAGSKLWEISLRLCGIDETAH
jgi:NAD(P)-dependent dehydrogenase (short-subunit alcohol dehydrogenase family)